MDRHEFRLNSYVTLTWQMPLFSAAAAFALSRFLEGDMAWVVWLVPVCVLALTMPYIVRIGELARDLRRGERRTARLRLRDVSEEYAIAIHRHRGMVHWTLIFEDEEQSGQLLSLSVAARRSEAVSLFALGESYLVEWMPHSRLIRALQRA